MADEMDVGHELLNVPLPSMVARLGMGIAIAQRELDNVSIETSRMLADETIDIIPGYTQTIAEDGKVSYSNAPPIKMSLLQVGLMPTFYQFAEATIEVSMDIKVTTATETSVTAKAEAKVGFSVWSASISSEVSHNRRMGKEVHGTSRLITRLVTVPPPARMEPVLTVIDNRKSPAEDSSGKKTT